MNHNCPGCSSTVVGQLQHRLPCPAINTRSMYNNVPISNRKCLPESHESCVCYGTEKASIYALLFNKDKDESHAWKATIELRSDVSSAGPEVNSSFIFLIDFSKSIYFKTVTPRTRTTRVVTNHDSKHNILGRSNNL